jgi:signal recognition particle receptor subunit beta
MVFFNYATMQMAAKIVYYGPGLCGKTTNLHHIYAKTSPQSRGEMVSLETETDRTLFFDLLPIDVGVIGGFKTRLQLYTIPGQVFYNTTRKLVLKGVDGLVFVADSQIAMIEANLDSFKNLRDNLGEIGLSLSDIPLVLQLNKRDLPSVASAESLLNALDPERKYEHVEAIAATGAGVFETLKLISKLTLRTLRQRMTADEPAKHGARPAARESAQFRVKEQKPSRVVTAPVPAMSHSTQAVEDVVEEVPASDEVASAPAATPAPLPEPPLVKTVKVRSTIDVMAELEALRKRATQTTPKAPKKEPATGTAKAGRELKKVVSMSVPAETLEQTRAMRVTVSFENEEREVVEERSESVDVSDASNVQSVSLNVRIDKA